MKPEMYGDLMGGVASVSGVFLGLYFTAISIGVGQQLSNLGPDVRRLIVTERKGTLYIRLLTTLTGLSFLLWCNSAAFGETSYPAILFVTCFGLVLIATFYPLGLQSFFLADPASIMIPAFYALHDTLRRMRQRMRLFAKPSFDKYFREKAASELGVIRQICFVALTNERRDLKQLSLILTNLFSQTLYYLDFKYGVESKSEWYRKTYQHEDWLMVDDTQGQLLEQSGGYTSAKEEPDIDWFEKEVLAVAGEILGSYSERKDIEGLVALLSEFRRYIGGLASRWEIESALNVIDKVRGFTAPIYTDPDLPFLPRMQLAEMTAILNLDVIQQAFLRARESAAASEIELLADCLFARRKPKTFVPMATKRVFEDLERRLASECRIEGRTVTARWYVLQVLAQSYSEQVCGLFQRLCSMMKPIRSDGKSIKGFEGATVSALLVQRRVEIAKRLERNEESYSKITEELRAFEKIPDLKVKILPVGQNHSLIKDELDRCYEIFGDLLVNAYQQTRDKELPDFFGMIYFQLANELFRQLQAKEQERFSRIYPKVLKAAFLARERLLREYSHLQDDLTKHKVSLSLMLDVMALGVYAAFYSEIHNTPSLFEACLSGWKEVLDSVQAKSDKLEWLVSVYQVASAVTFGVLGRDSIRFYWERDFTAELEDRRWISERFSNYHREASTPPSPLLKAYCDGGVECSEEIYKIFLAIFLPKLGAPEELMENVKSRFLATLRSQQARE